MTLLLRGHRTWRMSRDEEGYRTYRIKHLVAVDPLEGPARVLGSTPGLPLPGALWLVDEDVDLWAWCRPDATVEPLVENEPNEIFEVEQVFSNKPPKRDYCYENPVEDPLLQPMKVSGTFVKKKIEATADHEGNPIQNSAFEQFRGPQVEFDESLPTVRIEQNVPLLQLGLVAQMMDTVNVVPMWGLPVRCVKLSNFTWERKYYQACYKYYTRTFDFEVNYRTFDRDLLDEGTKALHGVNRRGEWVVKPINEDGDLPNSLNPNHFVRYKDAHGENARVILDGAGRPIDPTPGSGSGQGGNEAGYIHVEYYGESNFFLLGIPVTF